MTTPAALATPNQRLRILHLEDNTNDAVLIHRALAADGMECDIRLLQSRKDFEAALQERQHDLILSDYSLPAFDGLSALKLSRERSPDTPFIFISGTIGEERAVEALKQGAVDYVLKDRLPRLVSAVRRAVRESHERAAREIQARKIREQAALLDQAPDAIFVRDLEQRFTYWNKGAERLYGWSSQDVMGRPATEFLYPPNASQTEVIWKMVMEQQDWSGELTHLTKDGREVTVASRRSLLHDASGRPVAILNINTDVSEKKLLEAQVLRGQRLENIGALAGGIAHDLNNILAPILMVSDLLRDDLPEGPSREMLNTVRDSARRGAELVSQILQFARGMKGEPLLMQVRHVVKDLGALTKTFPRSIKTEIYADHDLHLVLADATQIHQVLLNLCVNARDAMPDGGKLVVSATNILLERKSFPGRAGEVSGPYVRLTVSDTGCGIPEALVPKIFEPFFTTKALGKGTGLGLSTVLKIVEGHRGHIEVVSKVGEGSTFHVYLPAATGKVAPRSDPPSAVPIGKGEHILLVDDEQAVLEMTREMLAANQYNVTSAKDGAEALMLFQERKDDIDVIVTDLMMPVMDGPAFIQAARRLQPDLTVICVSGLLSEAKLAELDPRDVPALLRKPYTAGDLLRKLRHVLGP